VAGRAYGEGSEIAQPGPYFSDKRFVPLSDRFEQCEKRIEEFARHGCGPSFILRMVWSWRVIETARK